MATLELNGKSLATQTSSAEPVIASTVTGAPALALTNATGTMPNGTQDNITGLGTVTAGVLNSGVTGAPTIALTNVTGTVPAGISGIGQLIGISQATGAGVGNYVTLENNKTYHCLTHFWANTVSNQNYQRCVVNGSGSVTLTQVNMLNNAFALEATTNAVRDTSSGATGHVHHATWIFEEGTTFDAS